MTHHGKAKVRLKTGTLMNLLHDKRGNVMIMMGAGLIPLTAMIGSGVDISRAYMVKAKLQQACDAGALAGRKAMNSTQKGGSYADDTAQEFFRANFANDYMGTADSEMVRQQSDVNEYEARATVTLPTTVMYIFGNDEFNLEADCKSVMQVSNSDITMVLDTTGSMNESLGGGGTRIQALRDAMKSFYRVVDDAASGSNARIRYAFVPYSHTVNVGKLLKGSWIAENASYQSVKKELIHYRTNDKTIVNNCTNYRGDWDGYYVYGRYVASTGECIFADDHGYFNSSSSPALYSYEKRDFNVSTYKGFNAVKDPTNVTNNNFTWKGCIEERETTSDLAWTYNANTKRISGNNGGTPSDLDVDSEPTSDARTQWKPYWSEVVRRRALGTTKDLRTSEYSGPQTGCPTKSQLLTKMTKSEFDTYANSLNPDGGTYHDVGMIWGARLSSPDGIFKNNVREVPDNNGFVTRHLIFMTDGLLDNGPSLYSLYGIEQHDGRVANLAGSTSSTNIENAQEVRSQSRFLAMCENVKAKGIRLWVISFSLNLTPELSQCASPDSAFVSTNAAELNQNFADIAETVAKLRLSQ